MVLAHADDEVIFGFPFFQGDAEVTLLTCSDDARNPDLPWLAPRSEVLKRVCSDRGARLEVVPGPSNFYRLPAAGLSRLYETVSHRVRDLAGSHDLVFTHNPHGEYGHPDHKLVFEIVCGSCGGAPVLYSDIRVPNGWPLPPRACGALYGDEAFRCRCDEAVFHRLKGLYEDRGTWTWVDEPVRSCSVFRLPRRPGRAERGLC